MMHRFLILSIHLLLSSVGAIEYCLLKGTRRFRYKPGSHYTARLPYNHPASEGILISLQNIPQEPRCISHMLCSSEMRNSLRYIPWTIPLN